MKGKLYNAFVNAGFKREVTRLSVRMPSKEKGRNEKTKSTLGHNVAIVESLRDRSLARELNRDELNIYEHSTHLVTRFLVSKIITVKINKTQDKSLGQLARENGWNGDYTNPIFLETFVDLYTPAEEKARK
jgi:hypothetical protein